MPPAEAEVIPAQALEWMEDIAWETSRKQSNFNTQFSSYILSLTSEIPSSQWRVEYEPGTTQPAVILKLSVLMLSQQFNETVIRVLQGTPTSQSLDGLEVRLLMEMARGVATVHVTGFMPVADDVLLTLRLMVQFVLGLRVARAAEQLATTGGSIGAVAYTEQAPQRVLLVRPELALEPVEIARFRNLLFDDDP